MRCVLGFDGGGTKTDCVLMDETGSILARSRSGPSNPMNLGTEAAIASLLEGAWLALRSGEKSESEVAYICGGIAGASEPTVRSALQCGLQPKFPNAIVSISSDLVFSLAATGESPSVVVIAGTGSAVLGRTPPPMRLARAGGFGPVIGDPGSAYDIGRKAAAMCMQKHLNNEAFSLGAQILHSLGCKFDDFFDLARNQPTVVFPKIFPIVAKTAQEGNEPARALLTSAAQDLHELAREVIEQLDLREIDFLLAKTGGVFSASPFLNEQFDCLARGTAPKARIGPLSRSIAEAAAQMARDSLHSALKFDES